MKDKEDPYFVLELMDLFFRITGKPMPCYLQRKCDRYARTEDSNLTINIKRAAMSCINDSLVSGETQETVGSETFKTKRKELVQNYSCDDFLKFLSYFSYGCVSEYINHNKDSPQMFFTKMVNFFEKVRKKKIIDHDFYKNLDLSAITVLEANHDRNLYKALRKISEDDDMTPEKGYILKIINFVFDFNFKPLPQYLQVEFDEHRMATDDRKLKDAVFVLMNETGKKDKLVDDIEPILLYYYNLCGWHFTPKYFLEFCVCGTVKALLEYCNESIEDSPKRAYELFVYILRLAKHDEKFDSFEEINEVASKIQEEDRDRIEHERERYPYFDSSESNKQATGSESLMSSNQHADKNCKCCTLN